MREAGSGKRTGFQPRIDRFMNASNIGTVNAESPCCGLYTIPFLIRPPRRGATVVTSAPSVAAMSPERGGGRTELRHRAQVIAFAWSEAIQADAEKALVQSAKRGVGGA
jgi:hypothetical protein